MEDDERLGAEIIAGEKKKRTVDNYKRLLKYKIVPYFRTTFFEDLFTATNENDDDEERFELDLSKMRSPNIRALFAHFSIKRDEEGNELIPQQFQSFSTVSSLNSALQHFYNDRRIEMEKHCNMTAKE